MRYLKLAVPSLLVALQVSPIHAQATNTVEPEPFFKVTTTVPDALGNEDGTRTGLTLEYFIDPNGEIADVALSPQTESAGLSLGAGSACKAKCFKIVGPPRREICMVNAGCGGQGGGGTLFVAPVLVEFSPKPDEDGGSDAIAFDINVYDFGAIPESRSVATEIVLPEGP